MNMSQVRMIIALTVVLIIFGTVFYFRNDLFNKKTDRIVDISASRGEERNNKLAIYDENGLVANVVVDSKISGLTVSIPDRIKFLSLLRQWGIFGYSWTKLGKAYVRENGESTKHKPVDTVTISIHDEKSLITKNNSENKPKVSTSISVNENTIMLGVYFDKNAKDINPYAEIEILKTLFFFSKGSEEKIDLKQAEHEFAKFTGSMEADKLTFLKIEKVE